MGSSDEEEEQEEEEEEEGNRKGSAAAPADAAKLKQLLQQAGNPARRAGGKTWGAAVDSESEELGDEQSLAGRRSSYQVSSPLHAWCSELIHFEHSQVWAWQQQHMLVSWMAYPSALLS